MGLFSHLLSFFQVTLLITSWYDLLEILLLTTCIYAFIRWLATDTNKNMVIWFYSYAGILFGTYYLNLQTLHTLLFFTSPLTFMIFIMLHQQTLQKNFITLTSLSAKTPAKIHWLEELIQSCLYAINKNREVFCIIERTDALDQFLKTNSIFQAEVTHDLLELLIEKIDNASSLLLWVTAAGKLHAINPTWHAKIDEIWIADEVKALQTWKQNALLMTHKSDAIMFSLSPTTRLCTLIMEGKIIADLSAHHAFALLKNYCSSQSQKGDSHVINSSQHAGNKSTRSES